MAQILDLPVMTRAAAPAPAPVLAEDEEVEALMRSYSWFFSLDKAAQHEELERKMIHEGLSMVSARRIICISSLMDAFFDHAEMRMTNKCDKLMAQAAREFFAMFSTMPGGGDGPKAA